MFSLAAAVLLCAASLAAAQDTCQVYYDVSIDMEVADHVTNAATTLGTCQTACDNSNTCLSFDFVGFTSCFLVTSTTALTAQSGTNNYDKQQACRFSSTNQRCFFNYLGASTTDNTLIGPLRGDNTLERCLQVCLEFLSCQAIHYNTSSSECQLIFATVGTLTADTDILLYEYSSCTTVQFDTTCTQTYVVTNGQAVDGGQFVSGNNTVAACQGTCDNTPECIGFDFNPTREECYLTKDASVANSINADVNHYTRVWSCDDTTTTCTYSFLGAYVPASAGTSTETAVAGILTLEECIGTCNNDQPDCIGITFNTQYNFDCRTYSTGTAFNTLVADTAGRVSYNRRACSATTTAATTTAGETTTAADTTTTGMDSTTMTDAVTTPGPIVCTWNYTQYLNEKAGGAMLTSTGITETQCLDTCSASATCTGIDYQTTNSQCWVHSTPYPARTASSANNENHYDKYRICGDCYFDYYPGRLGTTAASEQRSFTTEEECVDACGPDANCVSAAFNSAGPQCYFYTTNQVSTATQVSSANFYEKTICLADVGVCVEEYVLSEDMKISGGALVSISPNTAAACQAECSTRANCIGVDFNAANECYVITRYGPLVGEAGVEHYALTKLCNISTYGGCDFTATGIRRPSESVTSVTSTLQECFNLCIQSTTTCSGIAYDGDQCYVFGDTADWSASALTDGASTLSAYEFGACAQQATTTGGPTTTDSGTTTSAGCTIGWTVQQNMHAFNGLPQGNVDSVDACRQLCIDNMDCVGADITQAAPFGCWLHVDATAPDNLGDLAGTDFHQIDRCVTPTGATPTLAPNTCVPAYIKNDNMKKPGGQLNTANTVDSCQAACDASVSCVGFDFNRGDNTCWLTNAINVALATPNGNEMVDHYSKAWDCSVCSFVPYPNAEPGVTTQGTAQVSLNAEVACLVACALEATCEGATFEIAAAANSRCYFFSAVVVPTTLVASAGVNFWDKGDCTGVATTTGTTGTGTTGTGAPTPCTSIYRQYLDSKVFNGVLQSGVSTLADCEVACDNDAGCYGFDYTGTNACWLDRTGGAIVDAGNEGVDHYRKAWECGDCRFELFSNSIPNNVAGTLTQYTTVDTCLSACDLGSCTGATFNDANECRFYSGNERTDLLTNTMYDFYDQYECVEVCTPFYREYEDSKVSGASIVSGVNTLDGCIGACDGDDGCFGFDFTGNNNCWLDTQMLTIIATNEGVDHYTKAWECGVCKYEIYPRRRPTAAGVAQAITTAVSCLNACSRQATCVAAFFDTAGATECVFYTSSQLSALTASDTSTYYEEYDCVEPTGSTTGSGATTTSSTQCVPEYVAIDGQKAPNGAFNSAGDVAGCIAACEADNLCIGFDFNTVDNSCWLTTDVNAQLVPQGANEDVTHYERYRICAGCLFQPFSQRGATGGTVTAATTEDACLLMCAANSACTDINFDFNNNQCEIFTTNVTPGTGTGYSNTVHWQRGDCSGVGGTTTGAPGNTCSFNYEINENSQVIGGTPIDAANTVDDCKAACEGDSLCIGFDFAPTDLTQCWTTVGVPDDLQNRNGVTHYTIYRQCGTCRYFPQPARSAPGGTRLNGAFDLEGCLLACQGDGTCTAIDFNGGACYTFQGTANPAPTSDGTIHFDKSQCTGSGTTAAPAPGTTQNPNVCVPDYTATIGQKAPDGSFNSAQTVPDCQAACEANNLCVGFDFNGNNGCWLTLSPVALAPQGPSEQVTHYTRFWLCNGCTYRPYSARGAAGGSTRPSQTVSGCINACISTNGCQDINFNFMTNVCEIFTTNVSPVTGSQYANTVHWELDQCPP